MKTAKKLDLQKIGLRIILLVLFVSFFIIGINDLSSILNQISDGVSDWPEFFCALCMILFMELSLFLLFMFGFENNK